MINATSNAPIYQAPSLSQQQATTEGDEQELDQSDFLTLMVAQMKSQDPANPMDSEAFFGQIAQFSTVEGIQELNASFDDLAASLVSNQVLEASRLVGQSVLIPGNTGSMTSADPIPTPTTRGDGPRQAIRR